MKIRVRKKEEVKEDTQRGENLRKIESGPSIDSIKHFLSELCLGLILGQLQQIDAG
jgi:hypothetical protein